MNKSKVFLRFKTGRRSTDSIFEEREIDVYVKDSCIYSVDDIQISSDLAEYESPQLEVHTLQERLLHKIDLFLPKENKYNDDYYVLDTNCLLKYSAFDDFLLLTLLENF